MRLQEHPHDLQEHPHDRAIVLGVRPFHSDQERSYAITQDEIQMGGIRAVSNWMEAIEHDLISREREWHRNMCAPAPRATGLTQRELVDLFVQSPRILADHIDWEGMWNEVQTHYGISWHQNAESEAKARKLFEQAAGVKAAGILERGSGLPITGSAGGKYTLYKAAAYCVTRDSDQAKFCAVVPGVPLWDHVLGIKLMVEHDEPRFVATANQAGNPHNWRAWENAPLPHPGNLTATEVLARERDYLRQFERVMDRFVCPPIMFDQGASAQPPTFDEMMRRRRLW